MSDVSAAFGTSDVTTRADLEILVSASEENLDAIRDTETSVDVAR